MFIKMGEGWIKIHRKIKENSIWKNSQLVHLFLELLLNAAHKETKFLWNGKEESLGRGQLLTGRFKLAEATGISPNSIKDYLKTLTKLGIITTKHTNKFSIITIAKYNEYQDLKKKPTTKHTSQTPARHQPDTTYKNVKNDKNVKNIVAEPRDDVNEVLNLFYNSINPNINFANKTERAAADFLIKKYGLEKTMAAAQYAISVQSDRYAPTITTPYQLKEKMAALAKHKGINNESKTLIL